MIIIKCNKCGGLLHKTDKCFACGNIGNFEKVSISIDIHEKVYEEYERLEKLVRNGEFEEAISLSETVLEWMPFCSDIFWLIILSKNKCKTDDELIRKGFSAAESSDYYNAVLFGTEEQKKAYALVAEKIDDVQKTLRNTIIKHEYSEKTATSIIQLQEEFQAEIESRRNKLIDLWKQLEEVEHEMLVTEKDCNLLVEEYKDTLSSTRISANHLKKQIYEMKIKSAEFDADVYHKYNTKFDDLLHESEEAKKALDTMKKQHPLITAYNNLEVKRNDLVNLITNELTSMQLYENQVKTTVSEIEQIEIRHKDALKALLSYRFEDIRRMLGDNQFEASFTEAGIR